MVSNARGIGDYGAPITGYVQVCCVEWNMQVVNASEVHIKMKV